MARYNEFAGPKLPTQLLEKVYGGRVDKHGKRESSRKEKRKAERQSKKKVPLRTKAKPVKWQAAVKKAVESESEDDEDEDEDESEVEVQAKPKTKSAVPAKDAKPEKSILKRRASPVVQPTKAKEENSEDDEEEETDIESQNGLADDDNEPNMDDDDFTVSRSAAKAKLNDDDANIAALEKLLGMKGKKSKKVTEDEWDFLMNGDDGDEDEDEEELVQSNGKRKRGDVSGKSAADDQWLESKRKKARVVEKTGKDSKKAKPEPDVPSEDDEEVEAVGDDMDGLVNPFSDDEMSADDFDEYEDSEDEEEDEAEPVKDVPKKRENPYVAPVTNDAAPVQKYIPPSLRQAASSDEELLKQLRRQLQGLLNRLSEANLLSILASVQEVYTNNARQHVTSVLVDLLGNLISDPSVLTDTFLILHAGFSAALYRSIGTDFGAQLLENIVQSFDTHHNAQSAGKQSAGKQTLNLLAFLSNLYTLQATGCEIIFDYIRTLLANFSEANTELLLRVIRISGPQLRQDDPSALKDIVLILQRETSKIGEANLSIRTKFMIETILNLKNNRVKTGVAAKALSAEHMLRMKKILGSIKAVKTTEPLRITLADIRDSEKKGKWWLVGASWKDPAKHDVSSTPVPADPTSIKDVEDDDDKGQDLEALARSQGMNTSVRSAIFIAITGAVDFQHAQLRIAKLNLKNKQMLEIPRVLIHCVGMETVYNHFYTLVAMLFASDHKMMKAWQFAAYDVFRKLDASEEEGTMDVRQVYNVAKMYASLVAEGLVRITLLKGLDFAELAPKAKIFVQVLISTVFVLLRKKAAAQVGKGKGEEWKQRKQDLFEAGVKEVFEQAHAVPDMVLGLKYVVEKVVRGCEVVGSDEKARRVLEEGCDVAGRALSEVPEKRVAIEGDEGVGDSD